MYTAGDSIEFLRRVFGQVDIYSGGNVQVQCPQKDCHSRKRKLAINIEKNAFHCWVCEYKGTLYSLLKQYYPEHLKEFVERFCDNKILKTEEKSKNKKEVLTLPHDFRLLATRQNSKNPEIQRAIRYLYKRGLNEKDLWYWKFGISNQGKFDNRVILPSFSKIGDLNYYAARALLPNEYIKYLLPEQPKKEIIFNEMNIDWSQELTIVEGQFDLTKCNENAVCLSGSDLPEDSLLFSRLVETKVPVLLALDDDMQYSKTPLIAKTLLEAGLEVRILPLNGHHDVGEMTKGEFRALRGKAKVWDRGKILRRRIRGLVEG